MRSIILFSVSVVVVSFLSKLPNIFWLFIVILTFSSLSLKTKHYYFLAVPFGVVYGTIAGHILMAGQLPDILDGADVIAKGQVIGLPVTRGDATRFEFVIDELKTYGGLTLPSLNFLEHKKISISYNAQYNRKYPLGPGAFIPGQKLQLRLKLRRSRGFVNPVGFDYHLYLLREGFAATAYVKSDAVNTTLSLSTESSFSIKRDQLRLRIREFVMQHSSDFPNAAGALLALASGDKQLISDEQWALFKDTGTIHLMVISGLHIGLVAFFGFIVGRAFVKVFTIIFSRFISTNSFIFNALPSGLSIMLAGAYAVISGFGLPTQRALVMVCIFHFSYCLNLQSRPWLAFCLALGIVLILDPLAAHTPGFWLSFGAVGLLLFSFIGFEKVARQSAIKRVLLQWLKAQWVLLIGLGVPGIVLLGGVSVSGFVSNLVAIPIISFVVVPLALLSTAMLLVFESAAVVVLTWAQMSLAILIECLTHINDNLPSFYSYPYTLEFLAVVLGVVGACYFLAPAIAYRYIALFCFLPIIFVQPQTPFLRLTFLDVGQGTAIVIETEKEQMVYDAGKKYSERFDSGANIVAPYLLSLGYKTINTIMISHGDGDHAGGLAGLSDSVSASRLLVGETKKTKGEQCLAGQHWQWDGVYFEVLWPTQEYIDAMRAKPVYYKSNNISCVLLIKAGSRGVLLTGDIDRSIEKRIIDKLQKEQGVDIILAPHHGSKTSSSQLWVDTLQAKFVVFTAGYRNAYGHPHPAVVERYQKAGTHLLNTATDGAVRFSLGGYKQQWQLERWRYDYAHYWY